MTKIFYYIFDMLFVVEEVAIENKENLIKSNVSPSTLSLILKTSKKITNKIVTMENILPIAV